MPRKESAASYLKDCEFCLLLEPPFGLPDAVQKQICAVCLDLSDPRSQTVE
jgi:hypothetical protein